MRKAKRIVNDNRPEPKEYDPDLLVSGMIDGLPLVNEYIMRTHSLTHTEREKAKELFKELMTLTGFDFSICK